MKTVKCACVRAIMRNSDSRCARLSPFPKKKEKKKSTPGISFAQSAGTMYAHRIRNAFSFMYTKFYWIHISHIIQYYYRYDWQSNISSTMIGSMILANAILSQAIEFDWLKIEWKIHIRYLIKSDFPCLFFSVGICVLHSILVDILKGCASIGIPSILWISIYSFRKFLLEFPSEENEKNCNGIHKPICKNHLRTNFMQRFFNLYYYYYTIACDCAMCIDSSCIWSCLCVEFSSARALHVNQLCSSWRNFN